MLNSTQSAERIHIGFFGLRNVGKSSLVNKITNQEMSIVSSIKEKAIRDALTAYIDYVSKRTF